jgi:hypothetical protein
MPEAMGGSGENQAIRIRVGSVGGRLADRYAGMELLQRRSELLHLLPQLPELRAVAGPKALDLPVQLLHHDVHPGHQVAREPLGYLRTARQHRTLHVLDPDDEMPVVDLMGQRPEVTAKRPAPAISVDGPSGKDLLRHADEEAPHVYRLTHALCSIGRQAERRC